MPSSTRLTFLYPHLYRAAVGGQRRLGDNAAVTAAAAAGAAWGSCRCRPKQQQQQQQQQARRQHPGLAASCCAAFTSSAAPKQASLYKRRGKAIDPAPLSTGGEVGGEEDGKDAPPAEVEGGVDAEDVEGVTTGESEKVKIGSLIGRQAEVEAEAEAEEQEHEQELEQATEQEQEVENGSDHGRDDMIEKEVTAAVSAAAAASAVASAEPPKKEQRIIDPPPVIHLDPPKEPPVAAKKPTSGIMDAILSREPPSETAGDTAAAAGDSSAGSGSSSDDAGSRLQRPHLSPPPYVHHFDSYSLVRRLEDGGYTRAQAITAMKAVRALLAQNLAVAQRGLVSKSDVENETYLFSAACSELGTEVHNGRRAADELLRQQRTTLQHEVDILAQSLNQELLTLNDSVKGMFNDRKMAVREEQKAADSAIQQIAYKISVDLNSDARSEIEQLRWVLIRRAVIGIVFMAFFTLATLRYATYRRYVKQREAEILEKEAEVLRRNNGRKDRLQAPDAAEIMAAN